jgi:hypothetical protein
MNTVIVLQWDLRRLVKRLEEALFNYAVPCHVIEAMPRRAETPAQVNSKITSSTEI